MRISPLYAATAVALVTLMPLAAHAQQNDLDLKFAGALEFSDEGTLFVGDNYSGAIYAFDMKSAFAPEQVNPVFLGNIDHKIADVLGVGASAIEINDMAVHPVSKDILVSVSRIGNNASQPAIIKIAQDGNIELMDLASLSFQKQALNHYPDQETKFRPRGIMKQPPSPRDLAKGEVSLSSLAIMDMVYHKGELFVSGVAYENFLSTLRRMSYPFDGSQSAASVEMYHISHDQYETRAPIRAMEIQEIDGKDQLVAAYTCSPLVLVPLEDIKNGAKIAARTIGDMGNGQPLDMISYSLFGQPTLFVTSNSRSPQVIPLQGLQNAKVVNHEDFERGGKMDVMPIMPVGPMGKTVMFDGMSLHMELLSEDYFVSITRDGFTGSLNLDSNRSVFPNRLHNLIAEFDFPQYTKK